MELPRALPGIVRRLAGLSLSVVPYILQKPVLEWVLNRVFEVPIADGDLAELAGRTLEVRIRDAGNHWRFGFYRGQIVALDPMGEPDVTIAGDLREFLLLVSQSVDPDTLFFQRRLDVEGDTELGLYVKNLLDSMDWSKVPEPALKGLAALAR